MAQRLVVLALGLFHISSAAPTLTLQDLEVADDTQSVGSYVREVRAAAPQDYHKSYENEGDGEIGYSRKKAGGGKKGYQHFDSYHKKAGDHYEFEKQDSFGHDDEGEQGAHSHRHEQRERPHKSQGRRYRETEQLEPKEPSVEEEYERYKIPEDEKVELQDEPRHERHGGKKEKKPDSDVEKHYEELKEDASDGNGGVEAHGHDPRDYILPQKYSWEEAEN